VIYGGKYEIFNSSNPKSSHQNNTFYHGIDALSYINTQDLKDGNYLIDGVVIIEPNGYCTSVNARLKG
jgi:hypothetical protein